MTGAHLIKSKDGTMVLGLDVAGGPLTYSLESLPALLSVRDLRLLRTALRNALPDGQDIAKIEGESDGDYLARLISAAAQVSFVRRVA